MKSSKTGLKNGGESPPRSMSESDELVAVQRLESKTCWDGAPAPKLRGSAG